MRAVMTTDLEKSVRAEMKQYGENTHFVTSIRKMMAKEFRNQDEADDYANILGLGRTIFMGNQGLRLR